ncbi:MAG: S9 family peptidase [Gemmatimonadota bacterium]
MASACLPLLAAPSVAATWQEAAQVDEAAQEADASLVTFDRLYTSDDFRADRFGPARWLGEGSAYTTVEDAEDDNGQEIVRYDSETGERSVLVSAAQLTPDGADTPLEIEGYAWSPDQSTLLVYTNSKRVWRQNTRGDYWALNLEDGSLRQLGGDAAESTLMFAKFDPAGERVAYVRENDVYVEAVSSGVITRLTNDGSRTMINGTFDWVYEEEFGLRDGFRWSPDGERIAFWQLNAEGVRDFQLINDTDSIYSFINPVQYPKAGGTNSAARVGVVFSSGGDITWFDLPGDLRDNYVSRMEWSGNSDDIVIQRMNRLQNRNDVMLGDADSGEMRVVMTETDEAWLDAIDSDNWRWLDGDKRFTWLSERSGWRHLYTVERKNGRVRPVTRGAWDIISVQQIDEESGWVYFIASPDNPTQRYLYRMRLDGRGTSERLTPEAEAGFHTYNIAPGGRYALHTWSSFGVPPTTELVRLPDHSLVRTLVDNARLKETVEALSRGEVAFFRIPAGQVETDGWMMKPADFDPTKQYPILFYGYSEPAGQTVLDRWGSGRYLWHVMLTQQGYIVASIDNRGTPSPRGRAFRKAIYRKIGVVNTQDQAGAAANIVTRPFIDESRVGTWGWSGGGEMALNLIFRYPNIYGTAMAVAPVTHSKFYDTIYTERYMGLPDENEADYTEGAALTYANQLEGNLLIVHGSGDDNVHYQNTEALVNALVEANKPFQLMVYPNRTHGIFEGENTRRHLFELLTNYLNEHMPPGAREVEPSA